MRRLRVIFINRGHYPLYVEFNRCGSKDISRIEIRNRTVLRLEHGRYDLFIGYKNSNLQIKSRFNGVKDLIDIPSIMNSKCTGKRMLIHDFGRRLKLICNEKISVANIIEKLA